MKLFALYLVIAILVILAILLIVYERRRTDVKTIVLIAVMTSMSVVGRFLFAALPGFKPVTAIVVITGMYLGCEAGFFCGSLTALITNFYFGQGPWTPFQMLLWGVIGIAAGLFAGKLQKSRASLVIFGVLAGVIFSLVMDLYSVIWTGSTFSIELYLAIIASSLPYTVLYAVSNVFFLLVLANPMGVKLSHAQNKASMVKG